MDDPLVRVVAYLALAIIAFGAGALRKRVMRAPHPPITATGLGIGPGVVVFTSTDCAKCKDALEALRAAAVDVREVTHELEGHLQTKAGVESVPLTAVITPNGSVAFQQTGVPDVKKVAAALRRSRPS